MAPNSAVWVDWRRSGAWEHGGGLGAPGEAYYPKRTQVQELNRVADQNRSEDLALANGEIKLKVPVNGVAVLEVKQLTTGDPVRSLGETVCSRW